MDDFDDGVIEVQVIPQDDNWGETATTITETATSVYSDLDDTDPFGEEIEKHRFQCPNSKQALNILLSVILALMAVVSPIAFVIIPNVSSSLKVTGEECGSVCEGLYITIAIKEIVLIFGLWALYIRPNKVDLPRLNVFKVGMMVLVYVSIICFWLFYSIRMIGNGTNQYLTVSFASSFLDAMLFLHYMALVLMWIRPMEKVYTVSIIRNVDGMRRYYNIGQSSIQKAAVFCLERYYIDFTEYNPYMPRPQSRTKINKLAGLKIYDLDGKGDGTLTQQASKAFIAAAAAGRRKEGRNDRFYEEQELDRRIRKRKARLVAAAEEAFGHVARLNAFDSSKKADGSMDPEEAAQAVFPTLARPLQKYLRTTRQQLYYPLESILKHLAHCISYELSSKAFIERYTCDQPCISYVGYDGRQEWTLVSDSSPTRQLNEGTVFQLKHEDISLVIAVSKLPVFAMSELPFNGDSNRFVFRLNSETSV
ncbi:vang-like protein 1 [Clytia hemisphaerica]|uniref:Strabismus/van Gogh n=1 Tax=Clytia hemisphaerica TaxID=252671 RepID=I1YAR9_9CNID|nr:Strabismus/van Gogh [Clytia hemisphaerica]|eukprot:TCONS_00023719-protein